MSWTPKLLEKHKCPSCQNTFYCDPNEWAYKLSVKGKKKLYCKWTCLLKGKAEQAEKRKKRKENTK